MTLKNDSDTERLFEIIETALQSHNYLVLDGDDTSLFVKSSGTGYEFEIKILATEE